MGCVAIGYTIYPGTVERRMLYEQLRELVLEAKAVGLAVVVWAYPRGGELSKEGESGLDVCAYAAQLAAQLGAHIIKVKLPSAHIEQAEAQKIYEKHKIPKTTLTERVQHVMQGAFNGRRIVIFSGGAKVTMRRCWLRRGRSAMAADLARSSGATVFSVPNRMPSSC